MMLTYTFPRRFCNNFISLRFHYYFHTSSPFCRNVVDKKVFSKVNRYLEKQILKDHSTKKKKWYDSPVKVSESGFSQINFNKTISHGMQRRAKALGKIFYEHITSLLNNGEVEPKLMDLGFEVANVSVANDISKITVSWLANGDDRDAAVESILPEASHSLRRKLSSLYLMGHIPPIFFHKDMSEARRQEVEYLLSIADMGEDFTPTDIEINMIEYPVLENLHQSSVDKDIKLFTQTLQKQNISKYMDNDHSLENDLKNDVYEVNHSQLMDKVSKFKISGRQIGTGSVTKINGSPFDTSFSNTNNFSKYLSQSKEYGILEKDKHRYSALTLSSEEMNYLREHDTDVEVDIMNDIEENILGESESDDDI